jgi:hypothetical protein
MPFPPFRAVVLPDTTTSLLGESLDEKTWIPCRRLSTASDPVTRWSSPLTFTPSRLALNEEAVTSFPEPLKPRPTPYWRNPSPIIALSEEVTNSPWPCRPEELSEARNRHRTDRREGSVRAGLQSMHSPRSRRRLRRGLGRIEGLLLLALYVTYIAAAIALTMAI